MLEGCAERQHVRVVGGDSREWESNEDKICWYVVGPGAIAAEIGVLSALTSLEITGSSKDSVHGTIPPEIRGEWEGARSTLNTSKLTYWF